MSVNKRERASLTDAAWMTGIALFVAMSPLILFFIYAGPNAMWAVVIAVILSFVTTPVGIIIALIGFLRSVTTREPMAWVLVIINIFIICGGLYYGKTLMLF